MRFRSTVGFSPEFSVEQIDRYGHGEDGQEGTVKDARISFAGHRLIVIDSPIKPAFTFTPSVSLFVDFEDDGAMTSAFVALSDGGQIMMPPGDCGFSKHFAWTEDKFGVSWQVIVPRPSGC